MKRLWRLIPYARQLERENAELLVLVDKGTAAIKECSAEMQTAADALSDALMLVTRQNATISRLLIGGCAVH